MKPFDSDCQAISWIYLNAAADCGVFVGRIFRTKFLFEKKNHNFFARIVNDGKKW